MLARALYKGGDFLVLDEPTSALDPLAEEALYEEYYRFTKDQTAVFISHRLSSTQFCDRVIFLKEGRIVQSGTTLLEEQPKAMSQARAFLIESSLIISLARMFFSIRFITAIPAFFASCILLWSTAGIVPFPGRAIPTASQRQFMLLAVYIPEHDPQVGQVLFSNSSRSSAVMVPAA